MWPRPSTVQVPPLPAWAARLRRKDARGVLRAASSFAWWASPPLPFRCRRPERKLARVGQSAETYPCDPHQVCGLTVLIAPSWEATAAGVAQDPRLLLPGVVRSSLTQRNTVYTPWPRGQAPCAFSASLGLPRSLFSLMQQ